MRFNFINISHFQVAKRKNKNKKSVEKIISIICVAHAISIFFVAHAISSFFVAQSCKKKKSRF